MKLYKKKHDNRSNLKPGKLTGFPKWLDTYIWNKEILTLFYYISVAQKNKNIFLLLHASVTLVILAMPPAAETYIVSGNADKIVSISSIALSPFQRLDIFVWMFVAS